MIAKADLKNHLPAPADDEALSLKGAQDAQKAYLKRRLIAEQEARSSYYGETDQGRQGILRDQFHEDMVSGFAAVPVVGGPAEVSRWNFHRLVAARGDGSAAGSASAAPRYQEELKEAFNAEYTRRGIKYKPGEPEEKCFVDRKKREERATEQQICFHADEMSRNLEVPAMDWRLRQVGEGKVRNALRKFFMTRVKRMLSKCDDFFEQIELLQQIQDKKVQDDLLIALGRKQLNGRDGMSHVDIVLRQLSNVELRYPLMNLLIQRGRQQIERCSTFSQMDAVVQQVQDVEVRSALQRAMCNHTCEAISSEDAYGYNGDNSELNRLYSEQPELAGGTDTAAISFINLEDPMSGQTVVVPQLLTQDGVADSRVTSPQKPEKEPVGA